MFGLEYLGIYVDDIGPSDEGLSISIINQENT